MLARDAERQSKSPMPAAHSRPRRVRYCVSGVPRVEPPKGRVGAIARMTGGPLLRDAKGKSSGENTVMDFEHGLDFRSLDDAVAHARRCLSAGYDRTGNWDLAQTCRHLTDWLRAPLEGPPQIPWWMGVPMAIIRLTLGPRILKQFLGKRQLPVGMGTIDATIHPPEVDANAAVAAFAAMVAQFKSHTGPLMRPSPLLNRLEREQTLELQIVHCMHHFGRLTPRSGIGAGTREDLAQ